MSESYSYDENSEVWPYFGLTILSVVLVPWTIVSIRQAVKSTKVPESSSLTSDYKAPNHKEIEKFRQGSKPHKFLKLSNLFLLLAWLAFFGLIYLVLTQEIEVDKIAFDPYELLDVSFSATEKQIRTQYRKLSLKFHPDKIRDLGNSTREELEAFFVDITKAYKALTDPEIRENYLKYGHPDGPQQTSHGIALPNFLVSGYGVPAVIVAYSILILVAIPLFVGRWWNGSLKYTKNGLSQGTAATLFELLAKDQAYSITYEKILDALSKAEEFQVLLPKSSPETVRKLIDGHLNRVSEENDKLEADRLVVVAKCPTILKGFLEMAAVFKDSPLCQRILEVERCIVQAVPVQDQVFGELLQLPGVSPQAIKKLATPTLSSIINKPTSELALGLGISESNVQSVLNVAKHLPKLHLVRAYFKVPGEAVVTPQSLAHLVVQFAVLPPGATVPKIDFSTLNQTETPALLKDPFSSNDLAPPLSNAHAPFLPIYFQPSWYGFLVNIRDNKIIDGPAELSKVSLANLDIAADKLTGENITIATFKIRVTTLTPPMVGKFHFKLQLMSSGYFGVDLIEDVLMTVENPPPETEINEIEDDISDPEEDSIAGALTQLKGGKVKSTASKAPKDQSEDEAEDEDDLSDIDTDTEDEEEEEKDVKSK